MSLGAERTQDPQTNDFGKNSPKEGETAHSNDEKGMGSTSEEEVKNSSGSHQNQN